MIATCRFENFKSQENCNLFKRSFTTLGIGYTFNNVNEDVFMKENFRNSELLTKTNRNRKVTFMKSAKSKHSLRVLIENNAEEISRYEDNHGKYGLYSSKYLIQKPKKILVSLHNPQEPADAKFQPSTSIPIPGGHTTTVLFTPRAREIDDSGKELTESQRDCRLKEDSGKLDIFNLYSRTACLLECKMKYASRICGCTPWNFPLKYVKKYYIIIFTLYNFDF